MDQKHNSQPPNVIVGNVRPKSRLVRSIRSRSLKIVGLSVLIIGVLSLNGWLFAEYRQQQKLAPINEQEVAYNKAKSTVEESYLDKRGDQKSKVEYMQLIQAGDPDAALQLFQSQLDQASDPATKASVYRQLYSTATVAQQYEHALRAALGLAELQPGFESYVIVADTYGRQRNITAQVEYLQKAADSLSTANPEEVTLRQSIEEQIKGLQ